MNRLLILVAFFVLGVAGVVAVLLLGPAGDEALSVPETVEPDKPVAKAPEPDLLPLPPAKPGTEPETVPAYPAGPGPDPPPKPWRAPIRGLSSKDRDRMVQEAERQARDHVDARRRKELEMFVEIMGPLDEVTGGAFLDVYNGYYEELSREMRRRVTEAVEKARGTGIEPELPDRYEVEEEVRRSSYEKLEKILNGDQLDKFRAWWEKDRRPGGK